jgi:polysaccharide biosynthesis transport protein
MESQSAPQEAPVIRYYLQILRKYKWLLITTSLIGATIAAISAFRSPPIYRASAQLLIERAAPQVMRLPEVRPEEVDTGDYYPTQYGILKSRSLAREVMHKLSLQQHPAFVRAPGEKKPGLTDSIRGTLQERLTGIELLRPPQPQPWTAPAEDEQERRIIGAILRSLRVEPVRNSRLVTLSFEGRDPELIAQIVNALAEAYMNRTVELKFNAAQTAMQWLKDKVAEERKSIEEAEQTLQTFRERENILSPEGGEEVLVKKIATLNDLYVQMRVRGLEMEGQAQMLQRIAKDPKLVEAFPLVMQNQFIQTLKANYTTLELDLSELIDRYGYKHPSLQRKESQLGALRSNMGQGVTQVRQSVEMQAQLARQMEEYVRQLIDETRREVFAFHQKAIQYGVLQREVQAQNEIYNLLLRRLHEAGVTEQLRIGNATVIDSAEVPTVPVKPNKSRNTLVGLLVGLGIGVAMASALSGLDTTIRTPDHLQQLGLPFLGAIMRFRIPKEASGLGELIVHVQPHSPVAEAFRNVRTSVILARAELPSKALLLTSVAPGEGKTVVTVNLAAALAQAGRKVLLVEADMRKPRLGKIFHVEAEGPGLPQILGEGIPLEAAVRPTAVERLSLITCPTIPQNPSELLESERLAALIASAKERYDFVLFDSPPLMAVTDAAVLASRVDGVALVVKGKTIPRELMQQALATLTEARATVIGAVLNMVDIRRDGPSPHGYHYKYYGKYYGRRDTAQG